MDKDCLIAAYEADNFVVDDYPLEWWVAMFMVSLMAFAMIFSTDEAGWKHGGRTAPTCVKVTT